MQKPKRPKIDTNSDKNDKETSQGKNETNQSELTKNAIDSSDDKISDDIKAFLSDIEQEQNIVESDKGKNLKNYDNKGNKIDSQNSDSEHESEIIELTKQKPTQANALSTEEGSFTFKTFTAEDGWVFGCVNGIHNSYIIEPDIQCFIETIKTSISIDSEFHKKLNIDIVKRRASMRTGALALKDGRNRKSGAATIFGRLFLDEKSNTRAERSKWRAIVTKAINNSLRESGSQLKITVGEDIECDPKPIDRYVYMPDAVTLFLGTYDPQHKHSAETLLRHNKTDKYFTHKYSANVVNYLKFHCGQMHSEMDLVG